MAALFKPRIYDLNLNTAVLLFVYVFNTIELRQNSWISGKKCSFQNMAKFINILNNIHKYWHV